MRNLARFHPAAPASAGRNLAKTALQCALIWPAFLLVIPALLVAVEPRLGVGRFAFTGQHVLGASLFLAFTALNVTTGAVLSVRGRGTPLPLDCPNELVVSGPYACLRNPMALAGLGQGAAVGIFLGSWTVLVYVAAGITIWHGVLRPVEEEDLTGRFGGLYEEYRRQVRCWVPRLRPYRAKTRPAPESGAVAQSRANGPARS
jgi:protein-S-isoprenylcysteine O-methyltransferase Ste14